MCDQNDGIHYLTDDYDDYMVWADTIYMKTNISMIITTITATHYLDFNTQLSF